MAQAIPLSKADDILKRCSIFIESTKRFDDFNQFEFLRLTKDCNQLAKSDAVTANLYLASLYAITGHTDKFEYSLKVVENLNQPHKARLWRLLGYSNMLHAVKAAELADMALAHREDVLFTDLMKTITAVGGVHSIVKAFDNAMERNELLVNMTDLLDISRRASNVLHEVGLTQEHATAWIEAAGEVMRDHRLLWLGDGPIIDVFDNDSELRLVSWKFKVWTTAEEAARLDDELFSKIVDRDLDKPGVLVSFLGVNV